MSDETLCSYCHCPIEEGEEVGECPSCDSRYHLECWEENRGCAVYGCEAAAEAEKLDEVEIPVSFWGQEKKPCPVCCMEIMAAAHRCKSCGAVFESARPMEQGEFLDQAKVNRSLPMTRRAAIIIFIFCVLPCTSLLGAGAAAAWWLTHRKQVRELPALYGLLLTGGIAIGVLQAGAIFFFGGIHFILSHFQ